MGNLYLRMKKVIAQGVRDLFPGYFALVMATGIISIDAFLSGWDRVGWLLFRLNQAAYGTLWALTLARLFFFRRYMTADLMNHRRGAGFFSIVAGTSILGSQFVILAQDAAAGLFLWFLGVVTWVLLMYSFFPAVIVRKEKPSLVEGLNGGWLLVIVGTQSISILSVLIAPSFPPWKETILFFALTLFLLGGMLYLFIILWILYRLVFFPLSPGQFIPTYWISMGAIAITTLAGATLVLNASEWVFLGRILPFLEGFTLFYWVTGTWWIPLLLLLMVWRHGFQRYPLRYAPEYWGMVFPLGMYSTGTYQLVKAEGFSFLFPLSRVFFYLALITWLMTFCGMVRQLIRMDGPTQTRQCP